MRAILDANVLVSAALSSRGPSAGLVRAGRDGALELVASPKLIEEVAGVLRRDRLRRYLSLEEASRYLDALRQLMTLLDDPDNVPRVCRDPDDDYLVALAERHRIELLVSGDKDVIELAVPAEGVRVVTPREALQVVWMPGRAEP